MQKLTVLYVIHGHPQEHPGGAEIYSRDLYQAMHNRADVQPYLLSRSRNLAQNRPPLRQDSHDPNHYWLHTEERDYDMFFQEPRSPGRFRHWVEHLLRKLRPDVVHLQHTHFIGLNVIHWIREALPATRIVYTFHDFMPMCHRQGLLIRTRDNGLCMGPQPTKCHECFPEISAESHLFRNWHSFSRLKVVDSFHAPSQFLRDRYVEWGIPSDRIVVEEYGRVSPTPVPPRRTDGPRNRLAYFGQLNHFKGIDVLLRAVQMICANRSQRPPFQLQIHGANLEIQPPQFQRAFREHLNFAMSTGVIENKGPYRNEELPARMAEVDWVIVPSIWWENSPLVIQEAFQHGRPVICSDVGGMAEKVRHGIDGLHFRVGDSQELGKRIIEASTTAGLWERLHQGITRPHPLPIHCERLVQLYQNVRERPPRPIEPPLDIAAPVPS